MQDHVPGITGNVVCWRHSGRSWGPTAGRLAHRALARSWLLAGALLALGAVAGAQVLPPASRWLGARAGAVPLSATTAPAAPARPLNTLEMIDHGRSGEDLPSAALALHDASEAMIQALNASDPVAIDLARSTLVRQVEAFAAIVEQWANQTTGGATVGGATVRATGGAGAPGSRSTAAAAGMTLGAARAALSYVRAGLAEHDVAYLSRAQWLLEEIARAT